MITKEQTAKARQVADMTQAELSTASGVSLKAIEEFEAGKRTVKPISLQALRSALETAGWEAGCDARSIGFRGITIDPRKQGLGDELE
jgi:transcriptional regulator with XRE-family HTH domain